MADGSVTFTELGFVASDGPASLLARHNFETRAIAQELADVHVPRSLEIGCGFGRLSYVIAEHSAKHTAIDINPAALDRARGTYPDVEYKLGSADALPMEDASVQLIVTWTVLQHVPPDRIDRACREVIRVLAPGGTLLLCEETAHPDGRGKHTWHRPVAVYESMLAPLKLQRRRVISEIEEANLAAPGEMMLFR